MPLNTDFNLGTEGDGLFNDLLNAHDGLTDDESSQLNAAIILLLSNHIGYSNLWYLCLPNLLQDSFCKDRSMKQSWQCLSIAG